MESGEGMEYELLGRSRASGCAADVVFGVVVVLEEAGRLEDQK